MEALLLLGATGAGKTPLGELLEARGILGRRCVHFDFGVCLRRAAEDRATAPGLDAAQQEVVRRVLATGALLEDEEFPIAATLLRDFLRSREVQGNDLLLLNGLPRHRGQAASIDAEHRVIAVLHLTATTDVLRERIARDTGGDRAQRDDDTVARVAARIERYEARTVPLLEHYAARGTVVVPVAVDVDTSAADVYAIVARRLKDAR